MTTNRKRHLKSEFALFHTSLILFNFISFVKCSRNFRVESQRTVSKFTKEKRKFLCCVHYSIKRAREIRTFQVTVVQRWLRNVQKKRRMQVQTCCLTNLNLLLFCHSCCCRHRRCLNSLLLSSKNFATMVTLRHTSAFVARGKGTSVGRIFYFA